MSRFGKRQRYRKGRGTPETETTYHIKEGRTQIHFGGRTIEAHDVRIILPGEEPADAMGDAAESVEVQRRLVDGTAEPIRRVESPGTDDERVTEFPGDRN